MTRLTEVAPAWLEGDYSGRGRWANPTAPQCPYVYRTFRGKPLDSPERCIMRVDGFPELGISANGFTMCCRHDQSEAAKGIRAELDRRAALRARHRAEGRAWRRILR